MLAPYRGAAVAFFRIDEARLSTEAYVARDIQFLMVWRKYFLANQPICEASSELYYL
jgi:hypothetical protein